MTILPKPFSKKHVDNLPLFNDAKAREANQDKAEIAEIILVKRDRTPMMLYWYLLGIFLCGILASIAFVRYFRQNHAEPQNYKGWCALYVDDDLNFIEPYFRVMPVRQSDFNEPDAETYFSDPERYHATNFPDVEMIGNQMTNRDKTNLVKPFGKILQEMFEISDRMERIFVDSTHNGDRKSIEIMHDFTTNKTGIIEPERCYVMDLDNKVVLPPSEFVASLQKQPNDLDFSILKESFKITMPPMEEFNYSGPIYNKCVNRTTYSMAKVDNFDRKKRSADSLTSKKYSHFAGNHIQEINIVNMDDVIAYEKNILQKEK